MLKCWKGIFNFSAFCKPIIPEFKSQETWLITQKTSNDFDIISRKATVQNQTPERTNLNLNFQRGQFSRNFDENGKGLSDTVKRRPPPGRVL